MTAVRDTLDGMAGTLIATADRAREGESRARPFDFWRLAKKEATGASEPARAEARRTLYRHALIHAGLTLTQRGRPYLRCPLCRQPLR